MGSMFKKRWISPFVALTFLMVALTGLLMVFHLKNGFIAYLHQCLGIVCLVAAGLHLANNWRVLVSYFHHRGWVAPVIAAIVLLLIIGLAGIGGTHRRRGPGWSRYSFFLSNVIEQGRPSIQSLLDESDRRKTCAAMTNGYPAGLR